MKFEEIQQAALNLTPEERARLAHGLVQSLDSATAAEIEALWLEEAGRRNDEMDKGTVKSIPGNEVFKRIRTHLA